MPMAFEMKNGHSERSGLQRWRRLARIPWSKVLCISETCIAGHGISSLNHTHIPSLPLRRNTPAETIAGVDTTGRGHSVSTSESRQCCAVPPAIRAGLIGKDASAATFELDLFHIDGPVIRHAVSISVSAKSPPLNRRGSPVASASA